MQLCVLHPALDAAASPSHNTKTNLSRLHRPPPTGTFLNNTLQPADSSTWSNWQQLPVAQQLELLNAGSAGAGGGGGGGDQHMADSSAPQQQQPLTRANSAPELVKLTQADSAAWQQAGHAAGSGGGANQQGGAATAALLSHRDYWLW